MAILNPTIVPTQGNALVLDPSYRIVLSTGASTSSLLSGLTAYYALTEASGTVYDSSGNGYNSTAQSCTYGLGGSPVGGTSIGFSTTTSRITLPSTSSFNAAANSRITINAWVYMNVIGTVNASVIMGGDFDSA